MILDISDVEFTCGGVSGFPAPVANVVSMIINIIKIATPIIIIVLGMIDLFKAVTKQKDDEMKKAQMLFVKRLISGLLVFFIIAIVQFAFSVFGKAAGDESFMECISCFVNGVNDKGVCK